jgi:pimeloyl-ACP methyl ester carboxylesterase
MRNAFFAQMGWRLLFVGLLWLLAGWSLASDRVREQRIANEIEDAIVVGDPMWLKAGDTEFLAIHTPAEKGPVRGGVIILHGRGAHPNWVDVVQPLRSILPAHRWETLSLQMPVTAVDAPGGAWAGLIPEATPRIMAGIEFFRQRGINNLILIGHSLGARMAVEFEAAAAPPEIEALVAVGLPADRKERDGGTLGGLRRIRVPVLDIYGSRDIPRVRDTARLRAIAARAGGNSAYTQVEIAGADHFFLGLDAMLVARVQGWIARFGGAGPMALPSGSEGETIEVPPPAQ